MGNNHLSDNFLDSPDFIGVILQKLEVVLKKLFLMDTATCIQYLNFVDNKCDRILRDGSVSDDELSDLIIEFQGFQEKVKASNLEHDSKTKMDCHFGHIFF